MKCSNSGVGYLNLYHCDGNKLFDNADKLAECPDASDE